MNHSKNFMNREFFYVLLKFLLIICVALFVFHLNYLESYE